MVFTSFLRLARHVRYHGNDLKTFPLIVSDYDASDDRGATDRDRIIDDEIGVIIIIVNKYVDSNNGAITGTVTDYDGNPTPDVPIQLQRLGGTVPSVIGSIMINSDGAAYT